MSPKRTPRDDAMYDGGRDCDKCGGPTLRVGSGSIWCPDEDAHPGGHFVVRAAFARPPARNAAGGWDRNALPQRVKRAPVERIASAPTAKPVTVKPTGDGFDTGYDAFVDSKS